MQKLLPIVSLSVLTASAVFSNVANAELAGNIGLHSKYVLRGIFLENDNAAVQGGLDWNQDNGGFYVGWWFSNLGYEYNKDTGQDYNGNGFENDIYGGYVYNFNDNFGVDVGLLQYVYVNVDDANLTEFNLGLNIFDGYAKMQYLLNDGSWGNAGDIYWTAGYSFSLPKDFSLAFDLGYYSYNKDDPAKYGLKTTSSGGFRNFNTTLSYPIGKTGAEVYAQYIVAGEDRLGDKSAYDNQAVVGVTYSFDL